MKFDKIDKILIEEFIKSGVAKNKKEGKLILQCFTQDILK